MTKIGHCGQPYIVTGTDERIISGIHIAGSKNFSYGAIVTQEILNELYDLTETIYPQSELRLTTSESVLEHFYENQLDLNEYPDLKWIVDYSKVVGFPVAVMPLSEECMENIEPTMKLPKEIENSPYIHPGGFVPGFKGTSVIKFKKRESPFSEIASSLGVPNPKHPSITDVSRAPPALKTAVYRSDGEFAGESIYWAQVIKACDGFEYDQTNDRFLKASLELFRPKWESVYAREKFRALNDFEIRNGIQYGPYKGFADGMERSTSVGLPFTAVHKKTLKSSYLSLDSVAGKMVKVWNGSQHTSEFLAHIDLCLDLIYEGTMPLTFFKGVMKSELVDIREAKSRLFCAGGMDLLYFSSKFFGTFAAAVKKNFPQMECQVGVDPIRTLSAVWNRMSSMTEGACICMDYKRWDKTLLLPIMEIVKKWVVELIYENWEYEQINAIEPTELRNALEIIFQANITPVISVEGILYYTTRGAPSGSYFTTWLNSFCNSLMSGAVILAWQEERQYRVITSSQTWAENWIEVNYGDDKAVMISVKLIELGMNYSTFKHYSDTMFGTHCTPASKTGSAQELVPIEGIEFISRSPQHHHGGVWLNRLKKSSFRCHWHWIVRGGDPQEHLMENLEVLMLEALLWGQKEYELHSKIARNTIDYALTNGWFTYVQKVRSIPKYQSAIDSLERELQISCALYSSPASLEKGLAENLNKNSALVLSDLIQAIPDQSEREEGGSLPNPEKSESKLERKDLPSIKGIESQARFKEKSKALEVVGDPSKRDPQISITREEMLPPRYRESPFQGDRFKTMLWLHFGFGVRAIKQTKKAVGIWSSNGEYQLVCQRASERTFEGFTLVEYIEGGKPTWFCYSLTIQLAGLDEHTTTKLLNVMASVCEKVEVSEKDALCYYVLYNELNKPRRIYLTIRPKELVKRQGNQLAQLEDYELPTLNVPERMKTLKISGKQEGRVDTKEEQAPSGLAQLAEIPPNALPEIQTQFDKASQILTTIEGALPPVDSFKDLLFRLYRKNPVVERKELRKLFTLKARQQSATPQGVGSTTSTEDARAAPAAPSALEAQISNQENNGALSFGNVGAVNGLAEGGMMIQITEVACRNWLQVHAKGGPLINVPTTTPAGTILFEASILELYNNAMRIYAVMHERCYPSVELMLNFVGTATWAGNVLVAVSPTKMPADLTGDAADDWLRTWAYEQKPLSSNGTQVLRLDRLVGESQSNPFWDDVHYMVLRGPYVYIKMATSYEQALANDNTAFQIQILSRFGPNASFGGINWQNVTKMLAAVQPTSQSTSGTVLSREISSLSGMSFYSFLKGVLGQDLPVIPSLITNGRRSFEQDREDDFVLPKRGAQGYGIIAKTVEFPGYVEGLILSSYEVGENHSLQWINDHHVVTNTSGYLLQVPQAGGNIQVGAFITAGNGFSMQLAATWDRFITKKGFGFEWGAGTDKCVFLEMDDRVHFNGYQPIVDRTKFATLNFDNWVLQLSTEQYAVSYETLEGKLYIQDTTNMTMDTEHTGKIVEMRVEKAGIVDSFAFGWFEEIAVTLPTYGHRRIVIERANAKMETVLAQALGVLLPQDCHRLEIASTVVPIISASSDIPTTMSIENAALLRFLKQQTPDGYYTVIELDNTISGRRAIMILYSPAYDTMMIYFKTQNSLDYAVFDGAPIDKLFVKSITVMTQTAAIPYSDASLWVSIDTTVNKLATIQMTIRRNELRNTVEQRRKVALTAAMRELVVETVKEITDKKEKKSRLRGQIKNMGIAATSRATQEVGPILSQKPRQIQVGKAWQEDKQNIMTVLSLGLGGIGGLASKAVGSEGLASKALGGSTTGSALEGSIGSKGVAPEVSKSAITPIRGGTYSPTEDWRAIEDAQRSSLPIKEQMWGKKPSDGLLNTADHIVTPNVQTAQLAPNNLPFKAFGSQFPSQARLGRVGENPVSLSNQEFGRNLNSIKAVSELGNSKMTPLPTIPNQQVSQPVTRLRETFNKDNSFKYSKLEESQLREDQIQETVARRFARLKSGKVVTANASQQGGTLSSSIEGGINAGLAEQQHGFDKENMQAYFEGLTGQQKQELINSLQLLEKQGLITSEQMKQQYGFDSQMLQQQHDQLSKEMEQQHEQDLEKQEINLRQQGALIASTAGINQPEQVSVPSGSASVDPAPTSPGSTLFPANNNMTTMRSGIP